MRRAGAREEEAPFAQIVEAHRYMESNEQIGKIVVTV
jgi:NADPH:quinone reductase-like Zn-dependent oxidoreductase